MSVDLVWNGDAVALRAQALKGKSAWAIGMAVLSDAKLMCPVNYGYLAASLMAASADQQTPLESPTAYGEGGPKPERFVPIDRPGANELVGEVLVGTAVEYGPYVEFGTVRADAQPFLRPALDMAQGKAPAIVTHEAKKAFGEYLK